MINEILEEAQQVDHPIARAIHKTEHTKGMVIGFAPGSVLKEHTTPVTTTLIVLKGRIDIIMEDASTSLTTFNRFDIPVNIPHAVKANEESLILLIKG